MCVKALVWFWLIDETLAHLIKGGEVGEEEVLFSLTGLWSRSDRTRR
jgi:hypothetical protein